MADELDAMLQADDQPPVSQTDQEGQDTDADQSKQTAAQQSPEEVEFNSLTGSAQERIKKLYRKAREAEEKLAENQPYVPPAPGNYQNPDQQTALNQLSSAGVALKTDIDAKVDERLNRLRWDLEQTRLEAKYDGSKGEPQYVREEVEEYIKDHPQYQYYEPEDLFKFKMFSDEFTNLSAQKGGTPKTGQTSTLRPTKPTVGEQALTPEYIEERMKRPDGPEWYDNNLEKINVTLGNMKAPE